MTGCGLSRRSWSGWSLTASKSGAALTAVAVIVAALFGDEREARAGDVDLARAIFAEGVKLYQRDDYEGARRLFKKAEAEHHAAPIVYNIGLRRSASVTHRPPSTRTKPTSRRSVTLPS